MIKNYKTSENYLVCKVSADIQNKYTKTRCQLYQLPLPASLCLAFRRKWKRTVQILQNAKNPFKNRLHIVLYRDSVYLLYPAAGGGGREKEGGPEDKDAQWPRRGGEGEGELLWIRGVRESGRGGGRDSTQKFLGNSRHF